MLIIAHRLSTICEADQIAVLHKGKLEEVRGLCHHRDGGVGVNYLLHREV